MTPEYRAARAARECEYRASRTPEQIAADVEYKRQKWARLTTQEKKALNGRMRRWWAQRTPELVAAKRERLQQKLAERTPEQIEASSAYAREWYASMSPEALAARRAAGEANRKLTLCQYADWCRTPASENGVCEGHNEYGDDFEGAKSGFKRTLPATLYLLGRIWVDGLEQRKYGITNDTVTRYATHASQGWVVLDSIANEDGGVIADLERDIKTQMRLTGIRALQTEVFPGFTECWTEGQLDLFDEIQMLVDWATSSQ